MDSYKKWFNIAIIFILTFSLLSPSTMAEEIQPVGGENSTDLITGDNSGGTTEDSLNCIPAQIRIESWLETLIPLQEMCITPYDDAEYELTADNPVVGHLVISALKEATNSKVIIEDASIPLSAYGMYIEKIGEYGAGSIGTSYSDGWMYKKNFTTAQLGISSEELSDGDRVDIYYVGNWLDVVFSEITVDKPIATVEEELTFTLTDVDTNTGIADAVIYINGNPSDYITDDNGQVKIQFDTAGSYSISAERYENNPTDMSLDNNNIIRPVPITIDVQDKQDTQVTNVIKLINDLPEIVAVDEITKSQLTQVRTAYDSLTPEQQRLVTNINALVQKENSFITLVNVQEVVAKINQLPSVETLAWGNRDAVEQAILAYEALTEEVQALITNYDKLETLQQRLIELQPAAITTEQAYNTVGSYMVDKLPTPTFGNEWFILTLARGDYSVPVGYYDTYYNNVVEYVKSVDGNLHEKKYTDYSRLILALTSISKDPTNVGGYNLVEKLSDFDKVVWQGLNGAYFGLIALDTWGFELPETATTTRQKLIDYILSKQLTDGGFALSGTKADPDMTAMAIQALAPYQSQVAVAKAIDGAVTALATIQKENGGYASGESEASESAAQVITALSSLGIDVMQDARFNKVLPNMMSFYSSTDGGFKHVLSETKANGMATEQVGYTLAAYHRLVNGQSTLYDMLDTKPVATTPGGTVQPKPSETVQPKPEETVQPKPSETVQPKPEETVQPKPEQVYGYSKFSIVISSSEVPLAPITTEIFKGETVFDVLKRVTEENGISLNYRKTGYGIYIDGINDLYEFDRGPESGWMYRVNGVFPSYSAALHVLQPGDRVEWLYTTNLGKDVDGYIEDIEKAPEQPKNSGGSGGSGGSSGGKGSSSPTQKEDNKTSTTVDSPKTAFTAEDIKQYVQNNVTTIAVQDTQGAKLEIPTSTLSSIHLAADEKIVTAVTAQAEGKQIDVSLFIESADGTSKAISTGKAYAKITLPASDVTANTVVLQSVNGEYKAVPHKIVDGEIIILTKSSGTFVVMEETVTFKDITEIFNKEEIEFLASRHIIKGVNVDEFAPNKPITRAQFAVMISRALGLQASEENSFSDTKGKWYEQEIQALFEAGITTGKTADTFDPDAHITRQQAAAFMARVLAYVNFQAQSSTEANFNDANAISTEFKQSINLLNSLNIMTGKADGTFDPYSSLTRAQMAKILKRTLNIADLM